MKKQPRRFSSFLFICSLALALCSTAEPARGQATSEFANRKSFLIDLYAGDAVANWTTPPPSPITNSIANQRYAKQGFFYAQALFEAALRRHEAGDTVNRNLYFNKARQLIDWGLIAINVESSSANGDRCFNYHAAMDCFRRWHSLNVPWLPASPASTRKYWTQAQGDTLKAAMTESTSWNSGRTNNHKLMYQTARYLAGKTWPTATFAGGYNHFGESNTDGRKALLYFMREYAQRGNGYEWDSPIYAGVYLECYRSLYDLTPASGTYADVEMRRTAQMTFEVLLARGAATYNLGHWVSGTIRTANPFAPIRGSGGEANYLFFGGQPSQSVNLVMYCVRRNQYYTDTRYETDTAMLILREAATSTTASGSHVHTSFGAGWGGGNFTGNDRFYQMTYLTPLWGLCSTTDDLGATLPLLSPTPLYNTAPGLGWSAQGWRGGLKFWRGNAAVNSTLPSTLYVFHPLITPTTFPIEGTSNPVHAPVLGFTNYERTLQHRGTLLQVYNIPSHHSGTTANPAPFQAVIAKIPPGWRAAVDHSNNGGGDWGRIALHYGTVMVSIKSTRGFPFDPAVAANNNATEFRIGAPITGGRRKLAVVIEVASPTDYPGTTDLQQLEAFDAAVNGNAFDISGITATRPLVHYTTRDGTKLTIEHDVVHRINDIPVDYSKWHYLDNPWMSQAVNTTLATGNGRLTLQDPNGIIPNRVVYDFTRAAGAVKNVWLNRHVWVEAEEAAGAPGFAPFEVRGDGNASQSKYIEVRNGGSSAAANADYPFSMSANGMISIWVRVRADPLFPNDVGSNDSFWFSIHGHTTPMIAGPLSTTWAWRRVYNRHSLVAGNYTFRVSRREDGTQLDRLLFTTDVNYNPNNDDARR